MVVGEWIGEAVSGGTLLFMELSTMLGCCSRVGGGTPLLPLGCTYFFFFSFVILFFAGVWRPLWLTDFSPGLSVIRTPSALTTRNIKNPVLHTVQTTRP